MQSPVWLATSATPSWQCEWTHSELYTRASRPLIQNRISHLHFRLYLDCPKETVQVDPHKAQRAAFVLKNDREYEDEMVESGPLRSLLFILVTSSRSFQDAMMDNLKDRDMYKVHLHSYFHAFQSFVVTFSILLARHEALPVCGNLFRGPCF